MNIIELAEMHAGRILGVIMTGDETILISASFILIIIIGWLSFSMFAMDVSEKLLEKQTGKKGSLFPVFVGIGILIFIPFFIMGMVEKGEQFSEASVLLNKFPPGYIKKYCYKGLLDYRKILDRSITKKREVAKIIKRNKPAFEDCLWFIKNADTSLEHYRLDINNTAYLSLFGKQKDTPDRYIRLNLHGDFFAISPDKKYIYPRKGKPLTKEEFQEGVRRLLNREIEMYRSKHPKDFENISASLPQETMSHQDSKRKPLRPAPKKKKKISKEKKAKATLFLFGMLAVTFFVVLFFHLYSIRKDKRSKQ